jgi:hypothetical protein
MTKKMPTRVRRPYRIDLGDEIYLHVEVEGDPEPHVIPTVLGLARQVYLADRRRDAAIDPFLSLRERLHLGRRLANAADSTSPLDEWDAAIADLGRIEEAFVALIESLPPETAREALLALSRPEDPADPSEGASGPEENAETPS